MTENKVYVVDGARTPFIKALAKPNPLRASDLAVAAAAPLLARQPFSPQELDEVVVGCVMPSPEEANIARIIALRLGCGQKVTGWTVQRNCGSGLQAIDCGFSDIASGRHHLVLAGGTECMSAAPLLFQSAFTEWLADLRLAKGWYNKLLALPRFRPAFLKPVISLLKGLTDPLVNLSMGQTAEQLAYQFDISRAAMDAYAVASHQRAVQARENGHLREIIPLYDWRGPVMDQDNGLRADSSVEKLAQLKPVFDKPFGLVTAGNSSQVSDGAAFVLLASEMAIKKYKLPVLGQVKRTCWVGLDPAVMGLGPVHAINQLLAETKLALKDIDYWEINEAFAVQVLACLQAMQDDHFCREVLGRSTALGAIPADRLNVDGGAIAMGHPVAASGARLVLHLLQVLERTQTRFGVASLCIGGGQGGAMLLERVEGVK